MDTGNEVRHTWDLTHNLLASLILYATWYNFVIAKCKFDYD